MEKKSKYSVIARINASLNRVPPTVAAWVTAVVVALGAIFLVPRVLTGGIPFVVDAVGAVFSAIGTALSAVWGAAVWPATQMLGWGAVRDAASINPIVWVEVAIALIALVCVSVSLFKWVCKNKKTVTGRAIIRRFALYGVVVGLLLGGVNALSAWKINRYVDEVANVAVAEAAGRRAGTCITVVDFRFWPYLSDDYLAPMQNPDRLAVVSERATEAGVFGEGVQAVATWHPDDFYGPSMCIEPIEGGARVAETKR